MKKLILIAASLTAGTAALAAGKPTPRVPAADLKWSDVMGPGGPSVAFVVGDMKAKGPAEYFFKFPAGFESGWHTHDGAYDAVVVKGSMTAQDQGDAAEVELAVGSYFGEPAKKNHRNGCSKAGECMVFIRADKGFSFHPMTAEGKPMPMPAPAKPTAAPAAAAPAPAAAPAAAAPTAAKPAAPAAAVPAAAKPAAPAAAAPAAAKPAEMKK